MVGVTGMVGDRHGEGQGPFFLEEIIRMGVGERVRVNVGVSTGVSYDVWDGG